MKYFRRLALAGTIVLLFAAVACSNKPKPPKDIAVFPCNSTDKVVTQGAVTEDKTVSADGQGSLKITTEMPTTIKLFQIPYPRIEGCKVWYKAKIKTQQFGGSAYLQMVVHFSRGGQITAQNYQNAIRGNTKGWVESVLEATVREGQKPSSVELNLVVQGAGTLWVDDVHVLRQALVSD